MNEPIALDWRGRVPYATALAAQRAQRDARIAGQVADVLWLLEHDPVITVGRRVTEPIHSSIPVVHTERGGLATYHGPGQLVGYAIVDLAARGISVRGFVHAVEEGLIRWLAELGVAGSRASGRPGVWVGGDKIAAVGFHFRRGVSLHGFALNLTTDLLGFEGFVPCGIADAGVTSLARVLGSAPGPQDAWEPVGRAVSAAIVAASTGTLRARRSTAPPSPVTTPTLGS